MMFSDDATVKRVSVSQLNPGEQVCKGHFQRKLGIQKSKEVREMGSDSGREPVETFFKRILILDEGNKCGRGGSLHNDFKFTRGLPS